MAKIECVQAPWFGGKRAFAKALFGAGAYVTDTSALTWWIFSVGGTMLSGPYANRDEANATLAILRSY